MSRGAARQGTALALALALWAVAPVATFWALVLAYSLAVLLLARVDLAGAVARLPLPLAALLLLLLAAPGVSRAFSLRADFASNEGLGGLLPVLRDRLRLERTPAIAPPLVSAARRQTFYVHARDGAEVAVQLWRHAPKLRAQSLGEGLYRVDYDPRRHGLPTPANGELRATLWVDDSSHPRALEAVTPLAHPRWFCTAPDARLAATVSQETDELVIVSAHGLQRRVKVADAPADCAFVDARTIAVVHADDPDLWLIDAASGAVRRRLAVGPDTTRLAASPERDLLAIARRGRRPELLLLELPSLRERQRVALPAEPDWLAWGPYSDSLVVATRKDASLHRVRAGPAGFALAGRVRLGRAAVTLGRVHGGRTLLVAVTDYRPSGRGHLGNHFVQDQLLSVDVASLRVTDVLLTARRSERQSRPGDVDRGLSPMGIAEAADGSVLVTFAGSDELWRLRQGQAQPQITDLGDVDLYAPHGVTELADGSLLVSSPAAGAIGVLAPDGGAPRLLRLAPDDGYLVSHSRDALARRMGERVFYEGTRSGIACQSCHMHADSDASAHNLGEHRLLKTLGVSGLLGTAPYLRDGTYPELADLEHVARVLYRGYLRRASGRRQTLEAYVESLPRVSPRRAAGQGELTRARRGVRAFVAAGCPTCHAFPAFTNLSLQRSGDLFPERKTLAKESIDTPSLLSVGRSAPYLNDGRAETLEDVLVRHNRANRHGNARRLSQAQRADLIAFLEGL